jgi:peptidoglycan hydrolase-like protein with peptidoglycan-binding domain
MKNGDRNGNFSSYNQGTITQVNLLQTHMNRLLLDEYGNQASGPVDGIFGPLTKRGVERLQNRLNELLSTMTPLDIDGIVGPFTKAAINMSC